MKLGPYLYEIAQDGCWYSTSHIGRQQRKVYKLVKGSIPPFMVVRHKCGHGLCINPDHLELSTRSQDTYDRIRKARPKDKAPKQKQVKESKLSQEAIQDIRDNYSPFRRNSAELAEKHGVKQQEILKAIRGYLVYRQ